MPRILALLLALAILATPLQAHAATPLPDVDSQYGQPGYGQYPGLGGLYPPVYDHYQWVDCAEPLPAYVISCRGPRVAGYHRQPHAADGVVGAYDYWYPRCTAVVNPTTIEQVIPCLNAFSSWMNAFQLRRIPGPIPALTNPFSGVTVQHEWTPIAEALLRQSGYEFPVPPSGSSVTQRALQNVGTLVPPR